MTRIGTCLAACALAAAALLPVAAAAHSLKDVEKDLFEREAFLQVVEREAPDFSLTDANGETVSLEDLRGTAVVLWFVYTRCPDECPLHSEAVARVQAEVNRTPMRDLVRFVTITTDPAYDTPEIMREYGALHGLDPANWMFLTSGADEPEATRELARAFGLEFTPDGEDYQFHGVVTHLIDREGILRARYHGLRFDPLNMILHINALTHDDHE